MEPKNKYLEIMTPCIEATGRIVAAGVIAPDSAVYFLEDLVKKAWNLIDIEMPKPEKTKTTVEDWINFGQGRCASRRLKHLLQQSHWRDDDSYEPMFKYIEDICEGQFLMIRGAGKHAWEELKSLLEVGGHE